MRVFIKKNKLGYFMESITVMALRQAGHLRYVAMAGERVTPRA